MSIDARPSVVLVVLAAVLAAPAGAVTATATATTDAGGDWPTYGRDAAHTGSNPEGVGPSQNLTGEWIANTGASVSATPVVAGDTVYAGDRAGRVTALHRDGTERWNATVSTGAGALPITASPTVAGDTVYVVASDGSSASLVALNATTGAQRWSQPIGADATAAPVVVDGTVYVGSLSGATPLIGEPYGRVTALSADGTYLWNRTDLDAEVASSPAVAGGSVYAATTAGTVYKLDADGGATQASDVADGYAIHAAPTVVDGSVYVGTNGSSVYRLAASDLSVRSEASLNAGAVLGSVAVRDGTVYAAGSGGRLFALDGGTLETEASVDPGGGQQRLYHAPSVVGGTVYVGTPSAVHAYDARLSHLDGYVTQGQVRSSVVASGGLAFVGTEFGLAAVGGETTPDDGGNGDEGDTTPPNASVTANDTNVSTGEPVEFDASNSTDDRTISHYRWDFDGDGAYDDNTTAATTVHAYDSNGAYEATVRVVDEAGNGANASVTVEVSGNASDGDQPGDGGDDGDGGNSSAPDAALSVSDDTPEKNEDVTFDASNSTDDGNISEYRWDFGDGNEATTTEDTTVVHSYGSNGSYTATVTVVDEDGNADDASVTVDVGGDSSDGNDGTDGSDGSDGNGGSDGSDGSDGSNDPDDGDTDDGSPSGGGAPSGGGGGGSQSTATPTPTPTPTSTPGPGEGETHTDRVDDGAASFQDAPVEQIVFQEPVSGNVSVTMLDGLPAGVLAPPGELVMAVRIEVPADAESAPATVRVPVDVDALTEAGVSADGARVYRWHDGEWQALDTRVAERGGGEVVLAADTPGFSVFAVAGQSGTPTPSPTPTEGTTSTDGSATGTGTSSPADDDRSGPFLLGATGPIGVLLLVAVAMVLLAGVVFWRLRFDGNVLDPPGE